MNRPLDHRAAAGIGETLATLSAFSRPTGPFSPRQELIDCAAELYEQRRLRARDLSPSLLGEPVWDMLLALYCYSARGEALSVSGLCQAADTPTTTALRWVHLLEQKKLIARTRDSHDARRAIISLTDEGQTVMSNYLTVIVARVKKIMGR